MKKVVYSIALYIALTGAVQAQTAIKETREDVADLTMLDKDLMIYSKKESDGQFLYTEQKNTHGSAQKATTLNAGAINAVIGMNADTREVYVFHQIDRRNQLIGFYTYDNGTFTKTGERKLPKLRNNSYNLGLFLSEDKNDLLVAAELGRTRGYDDLYHSKWNGEKWTKPNNLGKPVNSRKPEFAPFMANDSLFFSRKEDGGTYIYAVPLDQAKKATQEPKKLDHTVNLSNSFNAYYKKFGSQEVWISASNQGELKAYTTATEKAKVEMPMTELVQEDEPTAASGPKIAIEEAPISKIASADMTMNYGLNNVYISRPDEAKLISYLKGLPVGAAIEVIGYSDGKGSESAKTQASILRAKLLKLYIKQNFTAKKFKLTTNNMVLQEEGEAYRVATLKVIK